MSTAKKIEERNQKILRQLQAENDNKVCAECPTRAPGFVNLTNNTFICMRCSGLVRDFNHRVKSVSAGLFTPEEIKALQDGGNGVAQKIYLCTWKPEDYPAPNGSDALALKEWIRLKYVVKRWSLEEWQKNPGLQEKRKSMQAERKPISVTPSAVFMGEGGVARNTVKEEESNQIQEKFNDQELTYPNYPEFGEQITYPTVQKGQQKQQQQQQLTFPVLNAPLITPQPSFAAFGGNFPQLQSSFAAPPQQQPSFAAFNASEQQPSFAAFADASQPAFSAFNQPMQQMQQPSTFGPFGVNSLPQQQQQLQFASFPSQQKQPEFPAFNAFQQTQQQSSPIQPSFAAFTNDLFTPQAAASSGPADKYSVFSEIQQTQASVFSDASQSLFAPVKTQNNLPPNPFAQSQISTSTTITTTTTNNSSTQAQPNPFMSNPQNVFAQLTALASAPPQFTTFGQQNTLPQNPFTNYQYASGLNSNNSTQMVTPRAAESAFDAFGIIQSTPQVKQAAPVQPAKDPFADFAFAAFK